MNAEKLKQLCDDFPGARATLYRDPGNILAYSIGDKKFAYFKTSDPEIGRFSIRVTPERFLELTDLPGIKPARYMGRFHWVTIFDPNLLAPQYLAELVAWSYERALRSLSKAARVSLSQA